MSAGKGEYKWKTFVKLIYGIINCTKNKNIRVSPLEVLTGYKERNIAKAKILYVPR